ncbi:MAG: polysaccharide biosynthesis/export family protein [Opitutales bacterium]|nr:polysaccharide biosynthesis/export family protein [Opitutales bacterium]
MKFIARYATQLLLILILAAGIPASLDAQGGGSPSPSEGMGGSEVMTSSSYRIANLDVIRVTLYVADEVQFKTEARVSQNGTISLPYLGSVEVVGLTMDEVRERLYEPYNRDYYVEPHLDVAIMAYSERFVTVIGKVNSQGPVPFPTEERMYLLEAIARAGGWSNDRLADMRNVTITRTDDEGERQTIQVDARNITARDHPLRDGDLINVPERMW